MSLDFNGKNLSKIRESNLEIVIKLLLEQGTCSRVYLARKTGLKQATITNIINLLLEWNVVMESGVIDGKVGRKSIAICINQNRYRTIGIRISRKNIHIGVFSLDGNMLEYETLPLPPSSNENEIAGLLESGMERFYLKYREKGILGIGIALPGVYAPNRDIIHLYGQKLIPDDIVSRLSKRFGLRTFIENDANCGALAQYWYKKGKTYGNIVSITVNEGIGAGIIVNGSLYTGANGNAGEIGHMSIDYEGPVCTCGNRGCLELYCSTDAFLQKCRREAQQNAGLEAYCDKTLIELLEDVQKGEPFPTRIFEECCNYLGLGIVNMINLYDPQLIVISGKMTVAGNVLLDAVKRAVSMIIMADRMKNVHIRLSEFEDKSVICGATALVVDHVLKTPTEVFQQLNAKT